MLFPLTPSIDSDEINDKTTQNAAKQEHHATLNEKQTKEIMMMIQALR